MKKYIAVFALIVMTFTLCSCSDSSVSKNNSESNSVKDVINQQIEGENKTSSTTKSEEKTSGNKAKAEVDLTELNSTMVYSEVYHMTYEPEKYIGKTVRMRGVTDIYKDEDKTYYSCLIKDAAACCAKGIEFELDDGAEYPKLNDEVVVYGKFDTYSEGVYRYCRLIDAKIES
ncbi:MAG: hypothetical protein IJ725_03635 [Ruminococcus sp.]|nr:hypothetical protein [Ruminococcus sp.]